MKLTILVASLAIALGSDDPNPRSDSQQGEPFAAASGQTYDTLGNKNPEGADPTEPQLQKKKVPFQEPFPSVDKQAETGAVAPSLGYSPAGRRIIIAPAPLEVDAPGIPTPEPGNMFLVVAIPNFEPYYVEVEPGYTGKVVKSIVQDRTGLAMNNQIIKFKGTEVSDETRLETLGVKNAADIRIDLRCPPKDAPEAFKKTPPIETVTLFFKLPNWDPFALTVETMYTGEILKLILADRSGIQPEDQILMVNGQIELRNSTRLGYASLRDGDTVELQLACSRYPNVAGPAGSGAPCSSFPVRVRVSEDDQDKVLQMEADYNGKVMREILAIKTGIPVGQLEIMHDGVLITDSMSLSQTSIKANEVIDVTNNPNAAAGAAGAAGFMTSLAEMPQEWDLKMDDEKVAALPERATPKVNDQFP